VGSVILSRLDAEGFLVLDTNAKMPEQGIDVAGSLRVVENYYPGNEAPSVQIMGTKEEPIILKGMWRDDLIGLNGGAYALMQDARALWLGQSPCQLQWMGDDGTALLTRTGLVANFKATLRRADDIGWTLTFNAYQADESSVLATPQIPLHMPMTLADLLAKLAAAASAVAEAAILANNVARAVIG